MEKHLKIYLICSSKWWIFQPAMLVYWRICSTYHIYIKIYIIYIYDIYIYMYSFQKPLKPLWVSGH